MLMPTIFGERLFDNFMDDFGFPSVDRISASKNTSNLMRTDIKETEGNYELEIELPGYKKEDVKAELKDGYLTISAQTSKSNDQKDEEGNYLRRERYTGSCSRTFYVGKDLKQEDIHAKFENGILILDFPKEAPQQVEENHFIQID